MKRRVGINNVPPISALVRDYKTKHVKATDDHNSDFLPETCGESTFSDSASLSVPFIQKPYTSQIVANTIALSVTYLPYSQYQLDKQNRLW